MSGMLRAAITDDHDGPAEGEKAFVQGLCDRLAAEFTGDAALESAQRRRKDGTVTYTIAACEAAPGLPPLDPDAVAQHLREAAHEARKRELTSGPLFGREAAR